MTYCPGMRGVLLNTRMKPMRPAKATRETMAWNLRLSYFAHKKTIVIPNSRKPLSNSSQL